MNEQLIVGCLSSSVCFLFVLLFVELVCNYYIWTLLVLSDVHHLPNLRNCEDAYFCMGYIFQMR